MKTIIRSELLYTLGDPETPEDQSDFDDALNGTIEGSYKNVGGGIYTCADEEGTYVVTAL